MTIYYSQLQYDLATDPRWDEPEQTEDDLLNKSVIEKFTMEFVNTGNCAVLFPDCDYEQLPYPYDKARSLVVDAMLMDSKELNIQY